MISFRSSTTQKIKLSIIHFISKLIKQQQRNLYRTRVPFRLSSQAKLNVNIVLPWCTFQLKVQAKVKRTRQLQCSHLCHFFVYFPNVHKSLSLLKSFPCVKVTALSLSEGTKCEQCARIQLCAKLCVVVFIYFFYKF